MNLKIILTFILFVGFMYAQDFEYSMRKDTSPEKNNIAKFNIQNTITPTSGSNTENYVCEGDPVNIDTLIQKGISFTSMNINTFCNSLDGGTNCVGYTLASSPTTGIIKIITHSNQIDWVNTEKEDFKYTSTIEKYEKLFNINGFAILTKGSVGTNSVSAKGRTGVGCAGNYIYQIKKGTSIQNTFSGELINNINAQHTFNEEGTYTINYNIAVDKCVAVYEEKETNEIKHVHPFTQQNKETTKSTTKILTVQVIDDDGPDFTAPSGNVNCGLIYSGGIITLPPVLIQGESVIIPTTMRITNVYDVPINVTRVNAKFYNILTYPIWNQQPTGDIVVNSITTDPLIVSGFPFFVELQINPGQTRTIRVYINATVTTDTPDEDYNLRMNFDYNYPTPSHGCYPGDNGVGYCSGPITVDVLETPEEPEPVIVRVLRANVSVTPQLIDIPFIEAGRDTVNVSGRVNFTTYNTSGTPPVTTVTTTYPNGARVELISLILGGAIECLDSVVPVNITSNGHYKFTNVKLNEECLKYEINEQLVGTIDVEYTFNNTLYTNTSTGNSSVNTMIPPLECEIFYDMEGTNPESEKYNITVQIYHGIDMQRIIYTCGLEDMEQADLNGADEYEFNCEYEFKEEEDTEYIVQVIVRDNENLRTVWEASCTANVGLCLPYV